MYDSDIPSCIGCGAEGYFTVCPDCRQPDHAQESVNRNARISSHNDSNWRGRQ